MDELLTSNITVGELNEFRRLRQQHIVHGIGTVKDRARYRELMYRTDDFIKTLPLRERQVMSLLYLQGKSVVYVSLALHYSDRQIRRIKKKSLEKAK